MHTRFFSAHDEAEKDYELKKEAIEEILAIIPTQQEMDKNAKATIGRASEAIEKFVERFP